MEESKSLHSASLLDLCKAALQMDMRDVPSSRNEMIRAGFSTGSLPIALGNTANKTIAAAYQQAPATWRSFAATKPAANFKKQTAVRPSFAVPLELVPDSGGAVTHGWYEEETYDYKIDTYAKQLTIPRQSIINDDIGAFAEIIPSMGRAAARGVTNLVYTTMLSGQATFWTAARTNLITGATTTLLADGVGLQLALTELRKLKDIEGNYLGLTPHCLLVPPGLERVARELLASSDIQRSSTDSGPTGNIFENIAQLEVEPRLSDSTYTGFSITAWWLFSPPVNASVIVGFLDGAEAPMVETFGPESDIDTLGYSFRIVFDYGVALADFRGSIRSKGAA